VDAFLACSHFVLEQERQRLGNGAGAHYVVYNGVDPGAFAPWWERAAEVEAVRRQYGLGDEPVVLFAGKIRESKGVGLLMAAMRRVWARLPQAALALAGGTEFGRGRTGRETPFFKEFREQVAQAPGRVLLTGFVPHEEMARTYLLGDVFAAPSQKPEGMPLVLLEAAACGLPIITTRMGGIPEVVREGDNGLLLDNPQDPELAAEKILALLRPGQTPGCAGRLGGRGRELIEERFSWGNTSPRSRKRCMMRSWGYKQYLSFKQKRALPSSC
jgi:spore coat protein SA